MVVHRSMQYLRKVHFENSKHLAAQEQVEVLLSRTSWVSKLGACVSASCQRINIQKLLWKDRHTTLSPISWGDEVPRCLWCLQETAGDTLRGSAFLYLSLRLPWETFIRLPAKNNYKLLRTLIYCSWELTTCIVCLPHGSKVFLCQYQSW